MKAPKALQLKLSPRRRRASVMSFGMIVTFHSFFEALTNNSTMPTYGDNDENTSTTCLFFCCWSFYRIQHNDGISPTGYDRSGVSLELISSPLPKSNSEAYPSMRYILHIYLDIHLCAGYKNDRLKSPDFDLGRVQRIRHHSSGWVIAIFLSSIKFWASHAWNVI